MTAMLTRRELLQRGAAGVSILSLPGLLAACGGGGGGGGGAGTGCVGLTGGASWVLSSEPPPQPESARTAATANAADLVSAFIFCLLFWYLSDSGKGD